MWSRIPIPLQALSRLVTLRLAVSVVWRIALTKENSPNRAPFARQVLARSFGNSPFSFIFAYDRNFLKVMFGLSWVADPPQPKHCKYGRELSVMV